MCCNRIYGSTSSGTTGLFIDINCSIHLSFQDMPSPSSGCAIATKLFKHFVVGFIWPARGEWMMHYIGYIVALHLAQLACSWTWIAVSTFAFETCQVLRAGGQLQLSYLNVLLWAYQLKWVNWAIMRQSVPLGMCTRSIVHEQNPVKMTSLTIFRMLELYFKNP